MRRAVSSAAAVLAVLVVASATWLVFSRSSGDAAVAQPSTSGGAAPGLTPSLPDLPVVPATHAAVVREPSSGELRIVAVDAVLGNLQIVDPVAYSATPSISLSSLSGTVLSIRSGFSDDTALIATDAGEVVEIDGVTGSATSLFVAASLDADIVDLDRIDGTVVMVDLGAGTITEFDSNGTQLQSRNLPVGTVDVAVADAARKIGILVSDASGPTGSFVVWSLDTFQPLSSVAIDFGGCSTVTDDGVFYATTDDPQGRPRLWTLNPATSPVSVTSQLSLPWGSPYLTVAGGALNVYSNVSDTLEAFDIETDPLRPALIARKPCVASPLTNGDEWLSESEPGSRRPAGDLGSSPDDPNGGGGSSGFGPAMGFGLIANVNAGASEPGDARDLTWTFTDEFSADDGVPSAVYSVHQDSADLFFGREVHESADPVLTHSGAFHLEELLVEIPGRGLDLEFRLSYNSRTQYDGSLGLNFWHSYEDRLFVDGGSIVRRGAELVETSFSWSAANGRWESVVPGLGSIESDTSTGLKRYHLTLQDGAKLTYNQDGWLIRIADRFGNTVQLFYRCDRLEYVFSTTGEQSLRFSYHSHDRISAVTDSTGRTWGFDYDGLGRLTTVTWPDGGTKSFEYQTSTDPTLLDNLQTVRDASGVVTLSNQYDASDRVVSQTWGGNTATWSYGLPVAGTTEVVFHDFDGTEHRVYFAGGNRFTEERIYTRGFNPGEPAFYWRKRSYYANGLAWKDEYDTGHVREFFYDANGNVTEERSYSATSPTEFLARSWTWDAATNVLLSETDESGNTTQYLRDVNGALEEIVLPQVTLPNGTIASGSIQLDYNVHGQLTSIIEPGGQTLEVGYHTSGPNEGMAFQLVRDPGGLTEELTSFEYDELNRRTAETGPDGVRTETEWSSRSQVAEIRKPNGCAWTFTYDLNGRLAAVGEPFSYVDGQPIGTGGHSSTTLAYDTRGLLAAETVQVEDTVFETTTFEYDELGHLRKSTSPSGATHEVVRDERGKIVAIIEAAGTPDEAQVHLAYDHAGDLATITDARGNSTGFVYDGYRRLKRVELPGPAYLEIECTATGSVSAERWFDRAGTPADEQDDVLLSERLVHFDERDRAWKEQTRIIEHGVIGGLSTLILHWDQSDRLVGADLPDGSSVGWTVNAVGRLEEATDADGSRRRYTYAGGRISLVEHFEQRPSGEELVAVQTPAYDAFGRLTGVTQQSVVGGVSGPGRSQETILDARGLIVEQSSSNGDRSYIERDRAGRLRSFKRERGGTVELVAFDHHPGGLLASREDGLGNGVEYHYDARDRLSLAVYDDLSTESYAYDGAGNLTSFTDRRGLTVEHDYDVRNLLSSSIVTTSAGVGGQDSVFYSRDGLGRIVDGSSYLGATLAAQVTRAFDSRGLLLQETTLGRTTTSAYSSIGARTQRTNSLGNAFTWQRDHLQRTQAILSSVGAGGSVFHQTFDGASRLGGATFGNGTTAAFEYDDFLSLVGISYSNSGGMIWGRRSILDDRGNVSSREDLVSGLFDVFSYDEMSQLGAVTYGANAPSGYSTYEKTVAFNLDEFANRSSVVTSDSSGVISDVPFVTGQEHRYASVAGFPLAYDANGNLIDDGLRLFKYDFENRLYEVRNKSDGSLIASYTYGPFGRRLGKTVGSGPSAVHFSYVYDGIELMEVHSSTGQTWEYGHLDGIDIPFYLRTNGSTYYLHTDLDGSVMKITDSTGALVESYEYTAFGAVTIKDAIGAPLAASSIGNVLLFTGQQYDGETGLYHFRARAYSAFLGRFLQPDPMGFLDGENAYQFAQANPLLYSDPYGLWSWRKALKRVARVAASAAIGFLCPPGNVAGAVAGAAMGIASEIIDANREKVDRFAKRQLERVGVSEENARRIVDAAGVAYDVYGAARGRARGAQNVADRVVGAIKKKRGVGSSTGAFGGRGGGGAHGGACPGNGPGGVEKTGGKTGGSNKQAGVGPNGGAGRREPNKPGAGGRGPHGNSLDSPRLQHRYEISRTDSGDVAKTGISGEPLNKNGSSPRANRQVNELNRQEGAGTYRADVRETDIHGRREALDAERSATNRLTSEGHSLDKQKRPRPNEG